METTKSADGTVIAYDVTGEGPALLIALGAFCDRKTFVPPGDLTARFTVYTYDRRGRGDSGDTQPYSPEREIEDLATVIAAAGSRAFVFGHSSGAALALRAAAAGLPIAGVVAYEAPFLTEGRPRPAQDRAARIRDLVASGRRPEAVKYWMSEIVQAPAEMVASLDSAHWAAGLAALAHTLPYDLELTGDSLPVDVLAKITAPVLVLGGATSPDWFHRTVEATARAIPTARLTMIDGYGHDAPPEVLSPILTAFFGQG